MEKYRETVLILRLKLATPISLDCFSDYESEFFFSISVGFYVKLIFSTIKFT
ncbi:unnamed protein product [Brugia timori]|uniref:Uncharacterized protein n=1 Tax=Brugia timori TaxID=42155 RepID=A0A3P7W4V8_9BILA|nr:unnamed protein product [Brugia timori]